VVSGFEDLVDVARSKNAYLAETCILMEPKGMALIHTPDLRTGGCFEVPVISLNR
jgi:hypothetical protein